MDTKQKANFDKIWPKTRLGLEKAFKKTRLLIDQGEVHVTKVSKRSIEEARKLTLNLKMDRLYANLGRAIAETARKDWSKNRKISMLLKEIKSVDRNIRTINRKIRMDSKIKR